MTNVSETGTIGTPAAASRAPVGSGQGPAATAAQLRQRLVERRLAGHGAAPVPQRRGPRPTPRTGPLPLSSAQQRLWFLDRLDPGGVEYLVPIVLRLRGSLDVAHLRAALSALQARHEILRTRYVERDGEPTQVIDPPTLVDLPVVWTDPGGLDGVLADACRRGFDLAGGEVWRSLLVRLAADEHVLVITVHHIACDGWSAGLLAGELGRLYRTACAGTEFPAPPALQFADHAAWEHGHRADPAARQRLDWWRERLRGLTPLELHPDRPHTVPRDPAGARVPFGLPAATGRALRELGRRYDATPFMVLLAGFVALLARDHRQEDVAVGSPVSGRTRPETEDMVGLFVNTLVLRCDCTGDPSFGELLARVRETVLSAIGYQDVPFDRVVEAAQAERDLSGNPLVPVLFLMEEALVGAAGRSGAAPGGPAHSPDLAMEELTVPPAAVKVDLSLGLRQSADGALLGAFDFATALFDSATIGAMAARYVRLLRAVVADPTAPLRRLDLLDPDERGRLLTAWNDTEAPLAPTTLHELVERRVAAAPDAPAVVAGGTRLRYADLDERAGRIARRLGRLGVRRGDVVGVCLHREADLVCTLLGILKAGAAYLPLDPDDPADRLAFLARDAAVAAVVTRAARAGTFVGSPVLNLDGESADPAGEVAGGPAGNAGPGDLAYVIYTSGSTGRPKGVMLEHAGIVNRIDWMQRRYGLGTGDRVLQKTPATFDVSVWEFFWPLTVGATVVLAPPGAHRDPDRLAALIRAESVSHLHFVPSMLDVFLDAVPQCPPSVRAVFCSGESLRTESARRFHDWSTADLHNLYGPTEASVDVTAYEVDRSGTAERSTAGVPIGGPISNTRVYVLDPDLDPVPVGVPGECYLAGIGLARGYLGRPELTADRFVPDPFGPRPGARLYRTGDLVRWTRDGVIEFIGRIDDQVKVRGVRIELAEVEAGLAGCPRVAAAAAAVHTPPGGAPQLVGYVVPRAGAEVSAAELRAYLAGRLPAALVPGRYVVLAELPLTPNGKVDRRALPAPADARGDEATYTAPRSELEATLAQVWAQVLRLDRVGVSDDFFDLGGDSMRAIRLVGALRERGIEISVHDLFQHRTVAAVAGVARTPTPRLDDLTVPPFALVSEADRAGLPDGVLDAYPLSQVQAGMLYELMTDADRRPYHNVTVYSVRDGGDFSTVALRAAAAEVVARHEVLRTSVSLAARREPLQLVHASAAVEVIVEDLRGLPPADQAGIVRHGAAAERSRIFELDRAPLWRLHAYQVSDRAWWLAMVECHAILDGWSHNSLLGELLDRYRAIRAGSPPGPVTPPARRYADFVAIERRLLADDGAGDYWAEVLAAHESLRLPQEWGEPGAAGAAITVTEPIPELTAGLRHLAADAGVPVKSVFLAAFLKVMSGLTRDEQFVCGLVCNGRPEVTGGDEVFGMYLNTVPLPGVRPPSTWRDLIQHAARTETRLWPHRRYPLPAIQAAHGGSQPVFEAVFNFLDFYLLGDSGVDLERTQDDSPNEFPLQVTIVPEHLILTAQPERIRADRLALLARAHRAVLAAMVADPDGDATGPILAEADRAAPRPGAAPAGLPSTRHTLTELVAEQVQAHPEATAVLAGADRLSYAELGRRADRLAGRLAAAGAGPGRPVAVCLPRGVDLVVTLLAAVRAGAAFVPLDPADPLPRLAERVRAAGAAALVADADGAHRWAGLAVTVLAPDAAGPTAPLPEVRPVDVAYLMFTSGSTGGPKGVLVPHRGIANYIQWLRLMFPLGPDDRVLLKTPYTFDVSVSEVFWPLASGATLLVAPPELHLDPVGLAAFITEHAVTHACFVPSMLDTFLDATEAVPETLRQVYCAGEGLRRITADRFFPRSAAGLHNMYGPTEASIIATWYEVPRRPAGDSPDVPMGRALDNAQTYVLDPQLNPVPPGVPGELHLGGVGLAHGYVGQPALTAAQFVPDPFGAQPGGRLYRTGDLVRCAAGGELEFLGRIDHQVKISGVRIEPGEIEAVLLAHPAVRQAVVVVHQDDEGRRRLVAYLAPAAGAAIDPAELRSWAQDRLPALLVPAVLVPLDDLPLTASGKVNRRALPAPGALLHERPYLAPRTATESAIAEVWAQELGTGPVGVDRGFIELGGHSLAAMRVAIRLRQEHGYPIAPSDVLLRHTVAELAARVRPDDPPPPEGAPQPAAPDDAPAGDGPLLWFRRSGGEPPLFCVHPGGGSAHWYAELTRHLPAAHPVGAFQHPGLAEPRDAGLSTTQLAARYLAELRSARPAGPYRLFGWCGGAPIAWEMAIGLRATGAQVSLVLLDPMLQDTDTVADGGEHLRLLTECETAFAALRARTEPGRAAALRDRVAALLREIVVEHQRDLVDGTVADEAWRVAVTGWREQIEARLGYRYRPYAGAVHLLACDELAGGIHEGLAGLSYQTYLQRWQRLAGGGVTVHRVRGGNITSMLPPHVTGLATRLQEILHRKGSS